MSTLKDLYDIIKELKSLAKEHGEQEMADKVIEIQEAFFEMREQLEELKDKNKELMEKIDRLEDNSQIEADLEWANNGTYIRKSELEKDIKIRYCGACWQTYKKLYPVVRAVGNRGQCSYCHTLLG